MYLIVVMAVAIGTALPLTLWKCGLDPAHAGAAIQVTVDIVGVTLTCLVSKAIFTLVDGIDADKPICPLPEPR